MTLKKDDFEDSLFLAKELIKFPSVSPKDEGALLYLEKVLKKLGFHCYRMPSGSKNQKGKNALVNNLYAKIGEGKNLCFAGHIDVVPAGNISDWSFPPFAPQVKKGFLFGRGASDMKGAIAAFIGASARYLKKEELGFGLSLLITGDEEGVAEHGTKAMLPRLKDLGETIDHCIVGEPTNPNKIGEMIKIGRRGSLHGIIILKGKQGHVAYPHKAFNSLPIMSKIVYELSNIILDKGNKHFQPSNLEFLSIDTDNKVENIIPSTITSNFNIRFNTLQTEKKLKNLIVKIIEKYTSNEPNISWDLNLRLSGDPFLTKPDNFVDVVSNSITKVTGIRPELSTSGGTSDARFIKDLCPVIEFGSVGKTMHQVDEKISVKDLESLTNIYFQILKNYNKMIPK